MKLKDIYKSILRTSAWILLLLASISGYMSYRGALTLSHDIVVAVCYAVAVAGVIYLLALANIMILPALSHHNRSGFGWSAFILSIIIAILISSYTNLVGIAGHAVMGLDAKHRVETVQEVITKTSLSVQTAQNNVTSLKADQSRFLNLAKSERQSGTLSGSKGKGVITGVYYQAANIVEVAAEALESKKESLSQFLKNANSILQKMRDVLNGDLEIDAKILQIASLDRELQTAYEKMAATNLQQVLENSLGALDGIVAVSTSKSATLRKTQEQVIARIRDDLSQTKARYVASGNSSKTDIPKYPVWEPRFQTRLILAYAMDIIPYIVAAIAIDCGVFVVVLMFIALRKEMDEEEASSIAGGRKFTIKELEETLNVLNRINSSKKDDDDEGGSL